MTTQNMDSDFLYFKILIRTVFLMILMVNIVYAQNHSIKGTSLVLNLRNAPLPLVFQTIEAKTDFKFTYEENDLDKSVRLTFNDERISLKEVLYQIAETAGLKFKRINNNIHVSKKHSTDTKVYENSASTDTYVTVRGKVVSSEDDLALPGVNVIIKETSQGIVTDMNGVYEIEVPSSYTTLVFSSVGYLTKELDIDNQSILNVTLKPDITALEEVLVIGYGNIKRRNLTGSVAKLSAESIKGRPINRIDQALAGQMAGVEARAVTGRPGEPLQIRIRGGASLSAGNEPFYVIDGIPIDDLGGLNPDDIESIEVLKDAASASIYGSRGANGVVLITTKKGNTGVSKIQFSTYFGLQQAEKFVDMLNYEEWIDLNKEVKDKAWYDLGIRKGEDYDYSDSQEYRMQELMRINGLTSIRPEDYPGYLYDPRWEYGLDSLNYYDWQKEATRLAPIRQYHVSASGGNNQSIYHISAEYLSQDGIVIYTNYERISFRSNIETKLNDFIKVGLNLSPTISWNRGGAVDGRGGIFAATAGMTPVTEKEAGLETGVGDVPPYAWASGQPSIVAVMREKIDEAKRMRVLSTLYSEINILKDLKLEISAGWRFNSYDNKYFEPTKITWRNYGKEEGSASTGSKWTIRSNYYLMQSLLTYSKIFGRHSLDAVAGYSSEFTELDETYQKHNLFSNDKIVTFNQSTSHMLYSSTTENELSMLSMFGRFQYAYDDKYLLSASVRKDGSSKFGENNKWGIFPSFSIGWRVDNEPFMRSVSEVISNLKLKLSWGETGNNGLKGYYPSIGAVSEANYSFDGDKVIGYAPVSFSNTDLSWEKTASTNIGLEIGFFDNRLEGSFEYYYKKTTDLLLEVPIAQSTGFEKAWQNIGSVMNKGYEVELTSRNLNRKVNWETSFNISYNENKVLALGNENTPIYTGWGKTVVHKVGEPLVSYALYDVIGVYMSQEDVDNSPRMANTIPGDPKYRDVSGPEGIPDGVIDDHDITIVGHPNPDYIWGITNRVSWKNFDLSILLQGQWGNEIFSMFGRNIDRPTVGLAHYNAHGDFRNRWRSEENPGDGITPRIDATTANLYDSRWLYNGAFWKIKNLTIGYTVPDKVIKGISSLRIYISGENLFMKDHYDGGYSPEAWQDDYYSDWSSYPGARIYAVGLNVSF